MTAVKRGNVVEVLYESAIGGRRWVVLIEQFKIDHAGTWFFEGSYYDPAQTRPVIGRMGGFTMSEMVSLTFLDPKNTLFGVPEIKVGEYTAEFKADGVQIGCTFVPTSVVDAVYQQLHEQ